MKKVRVVETHDMADAIIILIKMLDDLRRDGAYNSEVVVTMEVSE